MKSLVSACLLGCQCKYSGGDNYNERVVSLLEGKEHLTICPEVDGGLPVPRLPAEISGGKGTDVLDGRAQVVNVLGEDVSCHFEHGAEKAVRAARRFGAGVAILKERSPSCGVRYIYDGSFTGRIQDGMGVAAAALARSGLLLFSEEHLPGEELFLDYKWINEKIVSWLKEKVEGAGAKGCVLGLSGGIDSAVVAALCKQAFPDSTLAAILPVESDCRDVEDAWLVARTLGVKAVEINLDRSYHALLAALEPEGRDLPPGDMAAANIKPRLRMTALYYLAARHNYLVIGTGNKSELLTGFFTKYGDGGVDLEPIGSLVKAQVYGLARHLGIPQEIINRQPSAGLWPGQTDEDELGFSYRQLDEYILTGTTDAEVIPLIEGTMARASHKLNMPPVCKL